MILTNIFKDKSLLVVFGISFLLLILTFILAYFFLSQIQGPLVVHFDTYKEVVDFKAGIVSVYGILFSAFFMSMINLLLANFLYYRERFLSHIFSFFTLTLSILILIAISVIISVN